MDGHEVIGSALTKMEPSDIDVHVPGLRNIFVEVHANIMKSFSQIEYNACRIQSTIEKTNVPYGEKIDCRYIIVVTVYYESGVEKEIMIDLTDGEFDPPVYTTGTVSARKINVHLNRQPLSTDRGFNRKIQKFDFQLLSRRAHTNTSTHVFVPDYKDTYPVTTLERVMEMYKTDRSEVNPQSVLFGYNIIASLDAIRRISDTNNKKKFLGGVDYKQTVETIISKENLCEPDWCSCNQGADHIYQHGSTNRTYVKLQCCGTTVCADLLTNKLKATYKAQFCPFSGPDGPHFMQFLHNSLLEPRKKSLMARLNQHWESTEIEHEILITREYEDDIKESHRDPNVGPHGDGCSCPWTIEHNRDPVYSLGNYDVFNVLPLDDNFEDVPPGGEMPELMWGDKDKDPPHTVPITLGCFGSSEPDEYKMKNISVLPALEEAVVMNRGQIDANTNTQTMKPHCNTPGCEWCMYKMKCFQTWASSLQVTPNIPLCNFAMSLPAHVALNL
jgi:hypothetical protein